MAQVKSRERVQDHGEVFTAEREVNAMLDMVRDETERIESRFLEPACGDGNFLIEVLRRKLAVVTKDYGRIKDDWQHYAWLAVSSLYGVELLEDNVIACRKRLFDYVCGVNSFACEQIFQDSIWFLLSKNIVCGDALTMLDDAGTPITFCEWSFIRGDRVKRRDYQLSILLAANEKSATFVDDEAKSLFSDQDDTGYNVMRSELVPVPVREYPPRNWWEVTRDG